MGNKRSSLSIILHSIINFLFLIIVLIILNLLVTYISNNAYLSIVQFFNSLLSLFLILFLVGMVNSLFWSFEFPLNVLAPLSGGVLGVFIVNLVLKILEFTQSFVYFNPIANIFGYNLYAIVFFATVIIGYLIIFTGENRERKRYPRNEEIKKEIKEKKIKSKQDFTWEEVGDEFRKVFFNIGKALNKAFDGKKSSNKKQKIKKKNQKKKVKKKKNK